MKTLPRFIVSVLCFFASLPAHAQKRPAADAYGQRLFEVLQSKNIQGFNELIPSYDLFVNHYLTQFSEDYYRRVKRPDASEEEIKIMEEEAKKILNETHKTLIENKEAREGFTKSLQKSKEDFKELLERGARKGIVWGNIKFIGITYKPDENDNYFSLIRNAELFFSHQGEKYSLKLGELMKLKDQYYGLDIQFEKLFK